MYVNQEILGAQMLMISCYANFQAQFPLEAHRKKTTPKIDLNPGQRYAFVSFHFFSISITSTKGQNMRLNHTIHKVKNHPNSF